MSLVWIKARTMKITSDMTKTKQTYDKLLMVRSSRFTGHN